MRVKAAGYIAFDAYTGEVMGSGYTLAQSADNAVLNHCEPNASEEEKKEFKFFLAYSRATWSLMEEFENEGAAYQHELDGVACTADEYYYGER